MKSEKIAGPGEVFVCGVCGRRSMDRGGRQKLNDHWDESCVMHAILCHAASVVLKNGLVIKAKAVQPN